MGRSSEAKTARKRRKSGLRPADRPTDIVDHATKNYTAYSLLRLRLSAGVVVFNFNLHDNFLDDLHTNELFLRREVRVRQAAERNKKYSETSLRIK